MNIIGYFLMKVMLKRKQILKQPSKTKNKRTKMKLLDHTLSRFFLNNKNVKTYSHKYEEGEKEKEMV